MKDHLLRVAVLGEASGTSTWQSGACLLHNRTTQASRPLTVAVLIGDVLTIGNDSIGLSRGVNELRGGGVARVRVIIVGQVDDC